MNDDIRKGLHMAEDQLHSALTNLATTNKLAADDGSELLCMVLTEAITKAASLRDRINGIRQALETTAP